MKKAFLLLAAISIHSTLAQAEAVFASCVTEFPTTSYVIETDKDTVTVNVFMHSGPKFGPFWNSIVVPYDLKLLSEYASEFVKLGDEIEVKWKKDQCTWYDDNFYCSGPTAAVKTGEQTIEPWSIYSSRVTEKNFSGKYEYIEIGLSFNMKGSNFRIPMRYYSDAECRISKEPLDQTKIKQLVQIKKQAALKK